MIDPPVKERWERVREATIPASRFISQECWVAILAETDKGRISEEKLRTWLTVNSFHAKDYGRSMLYETSLLRAIDNCELCGE